MKKLVTVLLLITIFSCALVLVGCTVNKDKNGDQIGQSNTLTTDPIVGKYKQTYPVSTVYPIKYAYLIVSKDGIAKRYIVSPNEDNTFRLLEGGEQYNTEYWVYRKENDTYELYQLNPISGDKVNSYINTATDIKLGNIMNSAGKLQYTRITDDEWPDCIPEE